MSNSIKIRAGLVLCCLVLALVSLGPTLFGNSLPDWWRKAFDPIHLGLDLQGVCTLSSVSMLTRQ